MDPRFEQNEEKEREPIPQRAYSSPGRRQLRLMDIFHAVSKHVFLIALCAVVGLVLGIALSVVSYLRGEMSKEYAISTSLAVVSQTSNGMFASNSRYPTLSDVNMAVDMVDSVIYVLKSDRTMQAAIDRLEGKVKIKSTKDISNNLNISQYKETQIIELTLYWRKAEEGAEILSVINEVAPKVLMDTLHVGSLSVINTPKSRYLIGGSINAAMWIYMTAFGIMLGVGFSVLELLLRPTLLSTQDMERTFGVEVLGEIPERRAYFRKKRNLLLESEDDEKNTEVVDNYIYLAHILKNRLRDWVHPIVYVTSSAQNEGKTTVIAHVAVHLAELGLKTLIIDFDTRNPKLGGLFLQRVEYENSINALYHGDAEKETCITSLTGQLDILPAVLERRPLPYDDALLDLVRDLKQDYDVVLMDTAPVGQVADTMSLNMLADVALLVVRFDSSSMESIRESLLRLNKSGMGILGCVVNGVKELTVNANVGNRKAYGAHASGRKPYRKREKSEEEREWERWERDRALDAEQESAAAAAAEMPVEPELNAADPVLAELDQAFHQMLVKERQNAAETPERKQQTGEKLPARRPAPAAQSKGKRDRRSEREQARAEAQRRKRERAEEAQRRKREKAEQKQQEKAEHRNKSGKGRSDEYGDMQSLLDILGSTGESKEKRK